MKQTGRPPEMAAEAPELHEGLEIFYDGFLALSSCRGHGYGTVTEIPWTAIDAYAQRYEIDGLLFDRFCSYIGRMDRFYLKRLRELKE